MTTSLVVKGNTYLNHVTPNELQDFGAKVERIRCMPDVPEKQGTVVVGGLMAICRTMHDIVGRDGVH